MEIIEITFDDFTIITDANKLDINTIRDFFKKLLGRSKNISL